MTHYKALNERRCRKPVCQEEVGDRKFISPKLVQITMKNVKNIKDRMKAVHDRQKTIQIFTPNITTVLKNTMKRTDFWHLVLRQGKVLFKESSLETLSSQQRFHDTRLITQNGRYYHLLSILPEVGCIAGFVLNC